MKTASTANNNITVLPSKGALPAAIFPEKDDKIPKMNALPAPLPSIGRRSARSESPSDENQTVFLVRPISRPVTELVAEKLYSQFQTNSNSNRDENGNLIPYMILGDPSEYEEIAKLMNQGMSSKCPSPDAKSSAKNSTDEYTLGDQSLDPSITHYLNQQEKALNNWSKHQQKWKEIENLIASKIKKSPKTLMMSKIEQYRLLVEDKILMEETFRVMEKGMVDWKTYYRVGNDFTGLMRPVIEKADNDIEYIRRKHQSYKPLNHFKNWDIIEEHKEPIKSIIPDLSVPQMGVVGYFDVRGKRIENANDEVTALEKFNVSSNGTPRMNRTVSFDANQIRDSTVAGPNVVNIMRTSAFDEEIIEESFIIDENVPEPAAVRLTTNHLYFESYTNEIACMKADLINEGTSCIHFEWVRESRVNSMRDDDPGTQSFYFYRKRGVILPGETLEIQVGFKSAAFGMYREAWRLITLPKVDMESDSSLILTLKGIALEMDKTKSARDNIEKRLVRMQAETTAKFVLERILDKVWHIHELRNQAAPKSKEEKAFVRQNHHMSKRVYYTPSNYDLFENLAYRVNLSLGKTYSDSKPFKWDCSIENLYTSTDGIQDRKLRHGFIKELNDLVRLASTLGQKPIIRSFYHTLTYDMISELCDKVACTSDQLRSKRSLPLDRPCIQKFILANDDQGPGDDDGEIGGAAKGGTTDASKNAPKNAAVDKKAAEAAAKAGKGGKAAPVKATPAPATKGGKKSDNTQGQDDSQAMSNKIEAKKEIWSKERKMHETLYRVEFKQKVRDLVSDSIQRIEALLIDAAKLAPKGLN